MRGTWVTQIKTAGSWVADGTIYRPNESLNLPKNSTQNKTVLADGNYAYDKVIPNLCDKRETKHIISKAETCLVEAFNSSMRDRLARLGRKTKAYSKSKEMLEISLALWVERKNTGRKNWTKLTGVALSSMAVSRCR